MSGSSYDREFRQECFWYFVFLPLSLLWAFLGHSMGSNETEARYRDLIADNAQAVAEIRSAVKADREKKAKIRSKWYLKEGEQ